MGNIVKQNQQVQTTSREMELMSLLETVYLTNPGLKGRLNVHMVKSYLELDDSSFGWTGSGAAMPWKIKTMLVVAHFKVGAQPGFGHVLYLGNKIYISADFVRQLMFSDQALIRKSTKFFPLKSDERAMLGVGPEDLATRVQMIVNFRGEEAIWEGYGVIGQDELGTVSAKGWKKPGMDSRKNIQNTLQTRALANLAKYNYPTVIPVAPDLLEEMKIKEEDPKIFQAQQSLLQCADESDRKETRLKLKEREHLDRHEASLKEARDRLIELCGEIKTKGIAAESIQKALGIESLREVANLEDPKYISDVSDALADFLAGSDNSPSSPTSKIEQENGGSAIEPQRADIADYEADTRDSAAD